MFNTDSNSIIKNVDMTKKIILLATLLLSSSLLFQSCNNSSPTTAQMASDYLAVKYKKPAKSRGDHAPVKLRQDALESFGNGNYEESVNKFKQLMSVDTIQVNAQDKFYLGLNYAYSTPSQWDKAIALFSDAMVKRSVYKKDAQWMASLGYIATQNLEDALVILKEISMDANNPKSEDAKKLIARIKKEV